MTKLFLVLFALLTLGATYMTVNSTGVEDGSLRAADVRQGGAVRGSRGGFRAGK